jgi:hypothetical protein
MYVLHTAVSWGAGVFQQACHVVGTCALPTARLMNSRYPVAELTTLTLLYVLALPTGSLLRMHNLGRHAKLLASPKLGYFLELRTVIIFKSMESIESCLTRHEIFGICDANFL